MVPEAFVRAAYQKIPGNFQPVAQRADSFEVRDTGKPGAPVVWQKGRSGVEHAADPAWVAAFHAAHDQDKKADGARVAEPEPRADFSPDQQRDEKGKFAKGGGGGGKASKTTQAPNVAPQAPVATPAKGSDAAWQADYEARAHMPPSVPAAPPVATPVPALSDEEVDRRNSAEMSPGLRAQSMADRPTSAYFKADPNRLDRVKDYTNYGHEKMNRYLRDPAAYHDGDKAEVQAKAEAFARDIAGAPKAPGPVLRGVKLPPEVVAKLTPGKVFTARGLLSTTTDPAKANDFAEDKQKGMGRVRCMMHMDQKSGVFLAGVSTAPEEMETVIPDGTRMRVDRVETTVEPSDPDWDSYHMVEPSSVSTHHIYLTET
jgi:hypothetical protein